jgi:hypothetical protein
MIVDVVSELICQQKNDLWCSNRLKVFKEGIMSEITMFRCPYCNDVFVPAEWETCEECRVSMTLDLVVKGIFDSISDLDQTPINKLTAQHRRILKGALYKLDSIMELLDRHPLDSNKC